MSIRNFDYVANGYWYSINITNRKYVEVKITDQNCSKTACITITQPMIRQSQLSIDRLQLEMYKQYIYQRESSNKHLLSHENDNLVINFTYPRCSIKPIRFGYEWIYNNQKNLDAQRIMKETLQKMLDHFMKQADIKLEQNLLELQKRYVRMSNDMDDKTKNWLFNACLRFQDMLQQNEQKANSLFKNQQKKLIDSNLRYFDELEHIKTNLETRIIDCDLQIKELSCQVSDIRTFALKKNDQTVDQIRKISKTLKDQIYAVKKNIQSSLKSIKPCNFDINSIEGIMRKEQMRVDEKLKEIESKLESFKNLETRIIVLTDQFSAFKTKLQQKEGFIDGERMKVDEKFKEIESKLESFNKILQGFVKKLKISTQNKNNTTISTNLSFPSQMLQQDPMLELNSSILPRGSNILLEQWRQQEFGSSQ